MSGIKDRPGPGLAPVFNIDAARQDAAPQAAVLPSALLRPVGPRASVDVGLFSLTLDSQRRIKLSALLPSAGQLVFDAQGETPTVILRRSAHDAAPASAAAALLPTVPDGRGRVTLPPAICRLLGVAPGDCVLAVTDPGGAITLAGAGFVSQLLARALRPSLEHP